MSSFEGWEEAQCRAVLGGSLLMLAVLPQWDQATALAAPHHLQRPPRSLKASARPTSSYILGQFCPHAGKVSLTRGSGRRRRALSSYRWGREKGGHSSQLATAVSPTALTCSQPSYN